jgi:hypothetical protein
MTTEDSIAEEPPRRQREAEFVLTQDDDCHWYVIPADKIEEAGSYFAAVTKYWEQGNGTGKEPKRPKWLQEVGGSPSLVRFKEFRIT